MENFAEFMEETLYGVNGFYTKGGGSGRALDFLTSPEVGDLFGTVLAEYIDNWYEGLVGQVEAIVVDCGCGPGSLVASIARSKMRNARNLNFYLVDRSPEHLLTASEKLNKISPDFKWSTHENIPLCELPTLVIGNELLDNLVFNIGKISDVYQNFEPDSMPMPEYSSAFGISGNIDNLNYASIPQLSGDYRIPLHVGISQWLDELLENTMDVTHLSVLLIDYMQSVRAFEDENWLRLYNDNQRIVGVDNVLNALASGKTGDITTDVTIEDLYVLFDNAGFSKLRIDTQANWLTNLGINDFCGSVQPVSGYDNIENWIKTGQQVDSGAGFQKERDLLVDVNGLGAFKVFTAKREV